MLIAKVIGVLAIARYGSGASRANVTGLRDFDLDPSFGGPTGDGDVTAP